MSDRTPDPPSPPPAAPSSGSEPSDLPAGLVRASVYFDTADERDYADAVLEQANPGHVRNYNGMVDGWVTQDALDQIRGRGLVVLVEGDFRSPHAPVAAAPPAAAESPARVPDPELLHEVARLEAGANAGASAAANVYEVHTTRALSRERRSELSTFGELLSFVPPRTWRMRLTEPALRQVGALSYVASVRPYTLAQSVTPVLLRALADQARPADGPTPDGTAPPTPPARRTFDLVLHDSASREDADAVRSAVEAGGGTVVARGAGRIRFEATLDSGFVAQIAGMVAVRSLSLYAPPALAADRARTLTGIAALNRATASERSVGRWTGAGEVVGVFDSGVDAEHPDLADRLAQPPMHVEGAATRDRNGHGTHVAGIIAGTGAASRADPDGVGAICGIAPEAKLVVVGIVGDDNRTLKLEQYVDLGPLLEMATGETAAGQRAMIVNLSLATSNDPTYDHGSATLDSFVYANPHVLVVVAAGNEGAEGTDGNIRLGTIGTPASAKNVLTVGASTSDRAGDTFGGQPRTFGRTWAVFRPRKFQLPKPVETLIAGDADAVAAISARGPTEFDSVKPEVIAPGTCILAPRASHVGDADYWFPCDSFGGRYAYLGGTSMAAPVVAGAAAVLRQYLREELRVERPSAALLKALLIASARRVPKWAAPDPDFEHGYPDFTQGFGRLDLSTTLPVDGAPGGRRVLFVDVPNDDRDALEARAPEGSEHVASHRYTLRVAAGATDPLRVVLAWTDHPGRGLQNNLQLKVDGPGGSTHVGNEEHSYHPAPPGKDKNAPVYDRTNNVELVRIEGPAPGDYLVRVLAQSTAYPPQGFALCACGQIESEALQKLPEEATRVGG